MRPSLESWIRHADSLRHLDYFRISTVPLAIASVQGRLDDLYVSLVGDLFRQLRETGRDPAEFARLGNALAQYASVEAEATNVEMGISRSEAALFSACAFYFGGYPASAYLTLRDSPVRDQDSDQLKACYDLLARPTSFKSRAVQSLVDTIRQGTLSEVSAAIAEAETDLETNLFEGPDAWIGSRLWRELLGRFAATNVRAVLPNGETEFWDPLVQSFLTRRPAVWEYFPSQIDALAAGLLTEPVSFTLQMPTGAGKTTLCETLLYWHAKTFPSEAAVLLVPYRSLAAELRWSMVSRLSRFGIAARAAYGGTVPAPDEVRDLGDTQVIVATPEALSGLIGAEQAFYDRISLVICDEGHLLDSDNRGVSLELLLARFRSRARGAPRFVFISAIVPNVEEINAWLGGTPESVVRSDYRPAIAEFALLATRGSGANAIVDLQMHPHEADHVAFTVEGFLQRSDFTFTNRDTGRLNTFQFASVKTQAVAAARKALAMGASVVFCANKRGNQGAVGVAEELLSQLGGGLPLPTPSEQANLEALRAGIDYLGTEFGRNWIGTQMLNAGAVLHHGDIPQEARDVLEGALRSGHSKLAVCTSTLAEGVNLPIRTLVLYSVRRQTAEGVATDLLTRDIKNLVGRAGRAASSTRGLVICANPSQWSLVRSVAEQSAGEPVYGALQALVSALFDALRRANMELSNALLETTPELFSLVDGIDATLINLASEELGQQGLEQLAIDVASQTYASLRLSANGRQVLQNVFGLRARRIDELRQSGRLAWIRETGARARLIDIVENSLISRREDWETVEDALDPDLIRTLLQWAWDRPEVRSAAEAGFRIEGDAVLREVQEPLFRLVSAWLAGISYQGMAEASGLSVDDALGVHTGVVAYALQTEIEQAVAVLSRFLLEDGSELAPAVRHFPEHLRYGVPTQAGIGLANYGIAHRRAYVRLGENEVITETFSREPSQLALTARRTMEADPEYWRGTLGDLVFDRTMIDLRPRS